MKKLLGILGTITLISSGVSTTVSCRPKNSKSNDSNSQEITDAGKNLIILNNIAQKIKLELKNLSFKEDIERNNSHMSVAYTRVSPDKTTYQLKDDIAEDLEIKNEIFSSFQTVLNNVNREIKNEYSNYYPNSDPIFFNKSGINLNLNFIDVDKLNKLSGLTDLTGLKAVSIDFSLKYQVKFKDLVSNDDYNASFNMTNEMEKFNLIKGSAISYFNKNIIDFYNEKNNINITTGDFKPLYDSFNIDYNKDIKTIDNIYKNILTNFINSNGNLKDKITYKKNKNFLVNQTKLFNSDYERGFYYNNTNKIFQNSILSAWIKNNNIMKANPKDFVNLYKKTIVPKMNVAENLELGQFKFALDYINLYGLTFSGYFSQNNADFVSKIILSKNKLDEKLTNFANIIIEFLKYYKVNFNRSYSFNVSDNIWNDLVKRYVDSKLTNYQLPSLLFKHFINDENVIKQNLPDLELLNFKQVSRWSINKINYDKNNNLFWFNYVGYDASFTFGSSNFYYMPFYYWFTKYRYFVSKV